MYPAQPHDAIIHIHQSSEDRLVLDIPPGKGSASIGCFAILWNGFMAVFTTVVTVALTKGQAKDFTIVPLLLIGLFWMVGLGFVYAWIKLKFERCFLLVDRERAVLRRMLLGWQSQTELELDNTSRAQLTESYKENERPVYRVTIVGRGGNSLHFGTSLASNEKDWCVDAINTLLKPQAIPARPFVKPAPRICEACGAALPDDAFETDDGLVICPACGHQQALPDSTSPSELAAAEAMEPIDETPLPDELPGIVVMHEESPERLSFSLPWTELPALRWLAIVIATVFALVWTGVTGGNLAAIYWFDPKPAHGDPVGQWFSLIFAIPSLFGILAAWSLVAIAACGRLTTNLDRERIAIRFHVGPFGKTWNMATPEITTVRLMNKPATSSSHQNPRVVDANVRVGDSTQRMHAAAVFAGSRMLVMTLVHEPLTVRFVVEKVRLWLRQNSDPVLSSSGQRTEF